VGLKRHLFFNAFVEKKGGVQRASSIGSAIGGQKGLYLSVSKRKNILGAEVGVSGTKRCVKRLWLMSA